MIPDIGERPVTADEWLARYILRREHVRGAADVWHLFYRDRMDRMAG